jgi:hypothetical protein
MVPIYSEEIDSLLAEILEEENDRFERIVSEHFTFEEAVEIAGENGYLEKYGAEVVEQVVRRIRD